MILVIDNYDSFTHNIVSYLRILGAKVTVCRNDAISVQQVEVLAPSHLVFSPGPGRPEAAGAMMSIISACLGQLPMLGVCLGHQAIVQALGGRIIPADRLMHGKACDIHHHGKGLFAGLPTPLRVGRYHSLMAERDTLPACLDISAWDERGAIMGVVHRSLPVAGVQFHPESVLTEYGLPLIKNFLDLSL